MSHSSSDAVSRITRNVYSHLHHKPTSDIVKMAIDLARHHRLADTTNIDTFVTQKLNDFYSNAVLSWFDFD